MTLLIENVRLIDPEAGTDTSGALRVEDGRIAAVGADVAASDETAVIDCGGKCLAPGIVDIGVKVCEPGERHKESFRSAGLAAAAGGVTTMVTRPDTAPAIDSPEQLEFVTAARHQAAPVRSRPWPR
jgi:dihydroorotase